MPQKISLKEAERKAFRLTFQDGLWDVLIGSFAAMFAIAPLLSVSLGDFWSSAIFLPVWGLAYLIVWLLRKYVVRPRIGVVKYGPARVGRLKRLSLTLLVGNLAVFALGIVAAVNFGAFPSGFYPLILGLFLILGFSLAAYLLDFPRLYAYGLLLALAPVVGEWLYANFSAAHHGFPLTFGVTSGVMILTGIVTFARFVHHNPLPDVEPSQERASNA
jgi:hypothetical protein